MLKKLLFLSLCFLPFQSFAQTDKIYTPEKLGADYDIRQRNAYKMPAEWFNCENDKDCTKVEIPCNTGIAVSGNYKEKAQELIGKEKGCNKSVPDTSTAICKNNQCATVINKYDFKTSSLPIQREVEFKLTNLHAVPSSSNTPEKRGAEYDIRQRNAYKMPAEWFNCENDTDCTTVEIPCNMGFAVSGNYKEKAQELIGKEKGCDKSVPDTSTAICKNKQCATVINKYEPK